MAAFALSETTGWSIVPPTVLRDGPLGKGMVQLWIEPDRDADVIEMIASDGRTPAVRRETTASRAAGPEGPPAKENNHGRTPAKERNYDERLRRVCLFDFLANNADRKGGHLLPVVDGHIYGVDHGICFAVEPKLRTVLWAWRGQSLSADETEVVLRVRDGLDGELGKELGALLSPAEVAATKRRAAALMAAGRFPQPDPNRPAIPWPPF